MKFTKAKNRNTGEIVSVQYAHNRLGNLRMWVEGKFYSDKLFDKNYEISKKTIDTFGRNEWLTIKNTTRKSDAISFAKAQSKKCLETEVIGTDEDGEIILQNG